METKIGESAVETKIGESAVETKIGESAVETKIGESAVETPWRRTFLYFRFKAIAQPERVRRGRACEMKKCLGRNCSFVALEDPLYEEA